jgi:hypothetical protein
MGVSLAEYIRTVVGRDLEQRRPTADPSAVFNLGDSGGSDVARHKDAYVGEAVEAEWQREATSAQAQR